MYQYVFSQLSNTFPDPLVPPLPAPNANMQGFINDYAKALLKEDPTGTIPATQIMNCFTPAQLPVISALANAYAVCDHWFSSVPSQTFTNRSFAHAGTASGYVNNSWRQPGFPPVGFFVNDTPTIYNLLEAANVPWRIYYGSILLLCQAFQNQKQLQQFGWGSKRRFFPMQQFYADIASAETFPSYVFIEPNFIGNPWFGPETDMHPQASPVEEDGPSNAQASDLSGVFGTTSNTTPVPLTNPNATWTRDQFSIDDAKLSGFQKELLALAILTAGDVFEVADFGGLLGDLMDHIGRDVYGWFAKLDKRAEAWPVIELLMRVE